MSSPEGDAIDSGSGLLTTAGGHTSHAGANHALERALVALAFDAGDDVEALLRAAAAEHADSRALVRARAVLAVRRGESAEAERLLQLVGDDAEAQLMLGQLEIERGEAHVALERAEQVERVHPGLGSTAILRAHALRRLGRARAAAAAFGVAAGRVGDAYDIHMERAEALLDARDPLGAVDAFFAAAACQPGRPEPYASVARLLVRTDAADRAQALLDEAMAGPVGRAPALLEARAEVALARGERAAAIAVLDELATDLEPHADTENRLAELYAAAGARARADEHINRALFLAPEHGPTWFTVGRIAAADGLVNDARRAYSRALAAGAREAAVNLAALILADAAAGAAELVEAEALLDSAACLDGAAAAVAQNRALLAERRTRLHLAPDVSS